MAFTVRLVPDSLSSRISASICIPKGCSSVLFSLSVLFSHSTQDSVMYLSAHFPFNVVWFQDRSVFSLKSHHGNFCIWWVLPAQIDAPWRESQPHRKNVSPLPWSCECFLPFTSYQHLRLPFHRSLFSACLVTASSSQSKTYLHFSCYRVWEGHEPTLQLALWEHFVPFHFSSALGSTQWRTWEARGGQDKVSCTLCTARVLKARLLLVGWLVGFFFSKGLYSVCNGFSAALEIALRRRRTATWWLCQAWRPGSGLCRALFPPSAPHAHTHTPPPGGGAPPFPVPLDDSW